MTLPRDTLAVPSLPMGSLSQGAAGHSGEVATPQEIPPAVGSTSEHTGDDGDEVWDRPSGSDWVKSAVTQLPTAATTVALEVATARDECEKLGDAEFPGRRP